MTFICNEMGKWFKELGEKPGTFGDVDVPPYCMTNETT